MRQTPRQDKDVVRLQRDVQVNSQLYTAMMNNAQELRIAQAGMTGNARLVDAAGVLPLPIRPRAGTVLSISAGLGVVVAMLCVLMARLVRPTVRTTEELERQSGLHTLATIPESPQQRALMRSRRLWRSRGAAAAAGDAHARRACGGGVAQPAQQRGPARARRRIRHQRADHGSHHRGRQEFRRCQPCGAHGRGGPPRAAGRPRPAGAAAAFLLRRRPRPRGS